MGRKAKQGKRHLHSPSQPIAAAHVTTPTTPEPSSPVKRPKPRDPITGLPLIREAAGYIVIHDEDESRPQHARGGGIPTRIHTAREDHGGLGGKAYAPEFRRYMQDVLPRIVAEEQDLWVRWWDVAYVRSRLEARLGVQPVMVTIRYLRDRDDIGPLAKDYEHSEAWVRRQISATMQMAETYFTHQRAKYSRTDRRERANKTA